MEKDNVHEYIRRLLALPCLPAEQIPTTFAKMCEKDVSQPLRQLLDYIDTNWMKSSVWSPANWSVFLRATRTNNHVEGWHRRLNTKACRGNIQFYILVPMLHEEASLVKLQMKLVKEKKLAKHQRKRTRQIQGKLFKLWDDYQNNTISTSKLLKRAGNIYGPIL